MTLSFGLTDFSSRLFGARGFGARGFGARGFADGVFVVAAAVGACEFAEELLGTGCATPITEDGFPGRWFDEGGFPGTAD